jgi:CRP-like cAMP-binding protein
MNSSHQQLRDVLSSYAEIPASEWNYLAGHLLDMSFEPREYLFREGEVGSLVHLIIKGLVRNFQNDDGRELVHGFDFEGRFVATYESLITGQPSHLSVQALEATETIAIPGAVFLGLYHRHPCWDRLGRRILEDNTIRRYDKEMRFRRYSAEEHYQLLIQRGSPLIERVPLRHLASYLGIAPETLSRIRGRQRDVTSVADASS